MPLTIAMTLVVAAADAGVLRGPVPPLDIAQTTKALTVKQRSGRGGTMHGNTRVELSVDGGTPAELPGYGGDINAPNVDHVIALDGGWLLAGWASGGSPYQSQDLRVLNDALVQTGKLEWFTYRSERCVLLRRDTDGWSVGIRDGTSREESSLRIDEAKVKPAFTEFVMTETTWSYCAPGREPLKAPKRVAWFPVSGRGFQVPGRGEASPDAGANAPR